MFKHNFVTPPKLVQVTAEDGKRFYTTPQGHRYESVTTFLSRLYAKPQLHKWRARVGIVAAAKVTRDSQKRGTSLHTAIEKYLLNTPIDLDNTPDTKGLFLKTKPIIDKINNIRLMEQSLYSDVLKLAGTPDCIADWCDPPWEAELAVIDMKSKTKIWPKQMYMEHWIQTAIYARMFNEHYGQMAKWAILVIGCPTETNGVVYKVPMTTCQTLLEGFLKDPVAFQKKVEEEKKRNKLTIKKPQSIMVT